MPHFSLPILLLVSQLSAIAQEPEQASQQKQQSGAAAASVAADGAEDAAGNAGDDAVADRTHDDHGSQHDHGPPIAPVPIPESELGAPGESVTSPEDYQKALAARIASFKEQRQKLEDAIAEQREIYIRYVNRENRTPAAKQGYFDQRQEVRELFDQTYLAALDVVRMGMDEEAATFLITWIQHRLEHDIYDEPTLEGAARLIDGGSQLTYLFKAAARSAVVAGRFEMAKQLLDAVDEEQMEDVDQALLYHLEKYQELYEEEKKIRERESAEDRLPRVLMKTTQGDVVIELFLDQAPSTVSHFIQLVEQGFYDGLDFHQVIDHLLALTGDPSGDGSGNCGKYLVDEHQREDARQGLRGSLVMAKLPMGDSGKFVPDSASSQFAILLLPVISVSEQQTVFGRVMEGMNAISRLRRIDPSKKKGKNEIVLPPDRIIEMTVLRRPETLPEPEYVDFSERR